MRGGNTGSGRELLSDKIGTRFCLGDFSRGWRWTGVDDVECLPKAEILVRDDFYGRESRGNEVPLNRPKAKSVGCVVWQFW